MSESQEPELPTSVTFHHKRSGLFRVVHADGVWGGLNQSGVIQLTFYAEHPAIPEVITYPLSKDGTLTNEPKAVGDEGIQREMEVLVALNIHAATQLRGNLDELLKLAANLLAQQPK
jgi:hypothetical protein